MSEEEDIQKILNSELGKAMVWCCGAVAELERLEIIEAPFKQSPRGVANWDQLDASGYRPNNFQILESLFQFTDDFETGGTVLCMLIEFRDNREEFLKASDEADKPEEGEEWKLGANDESP